MEPTKREFRQIKRQTKRAGSQHRRRQWKRDLRENPEEAPYSEERFGRYSTAALNGMDHDKTRIKVDPHARNAEIVEPEDNEEDHG